MSALACPSGVPAAVVRQARSTQRYQARCSEDEERLTERIVELASRYGRYGYRRVCGLLWLENWWVNHKRVERIWRAEGLKVPRKQPKRGRLWLNDGSCVRRRPERPNHVWAYDFCADRTHDGRPIRMLVVMDEFTRECLSIDMGRKLKSEDVLERLTELFTSLHRRLHPGCARRESLPGRIDPTEKRGAWEAAERHL